MGVPCKLGEHGIEQILEIRLMDQEQAEFQKSADAVKAQAELVEESLLHSGVS